MKLLDFSDELQERRQRLRKLVKRHADNVRTASIEHHLRPSALSRARLVRHLVAYETSTAFLDTLSRT